MIPKQLAAMLDGMEYPEPPAHLSKLAKENGFIIVCGCSDDLCEMYGAVRDETDCWDGDDLYVRETGFCAEGQGGKLINALWCPEDLRCSWAYKTDIPHSTFHVMENGELYCVGLVMEVGDIRFSGKCCPHCGMELDDDHAN